MSHVTVMTRDLVALLRDALLTAGSDDDYPLLMGVLIHCDRADVRVESKDDDGGPPLIDEIPSNVLVASAMDGFTMASQGHAPCEGWLHRAVLLAVDDVATVVKAFTGKGKRAPKSDVHRTKVAVSGDGVTFSEVHPAVLDGLRITVREQDLTDYPHGIERTLCPDPSGLVTDKDTRQLVPVSAGSGIGAAAWDIVSKVASARCAAPVMYRYHQRKLHVVEVGTMWRAVFHPVRLDDEQAYTAPRVPVFAPRLPKQGAENPSAEQSALV